MKSRVKLLTIAAGLVALTTPMFGQAQVAMAKHLAVKGSADAVQPTRLQRDPRDQAEPRRISASDVRSAKVSASTDEEEASRAALVADRNKYDPVPAQEFRMISREVPGVASTIEGARALVRYDAGDRVGALAILDRQRLTGDMARQARSDITRAAEARQIALLALDAWSKSDPGFSTDSVIARYEDVVRLDPGESSDWRYLVRLYRSAGRISDASAARQRIQALAVDAD